MPAWVLSAFTPLIDPLARDRFSAWAWTLAAAVSLTFSIWLACQPNRSLDYWEVRHWIDRWAFGAADPYSLANLAIDYPPHGLLLLSPIGLLPKHAAPLLFALANAALCVAACWLMVSITLQLSGVTLTRRQRWTLCAMLASWGAVRTTIWLGQTMPVALMAALFAIRWSARRPAASGAALGLATFKPNLAIGFVVAMTLLRRWRPFVAAAALVVAGTAWYAATVDEGIVQIALAYMRKLFDLYGGTGYRRDWLGIRAVLYEIGGASPLVAISYYAVLAVTLGGLTWLGWRAADSDASRATIFASSLVWTLSCFSHHRFNMLLYGPAFLLVLLPGNLLRIPKQWLSGVQVLLIIWMTLDVPLVIRLWGDPRGESVVNALSTAGRLSQRLFLVSTLGLLLLALARLPRRTQAFGRAPDR